MEKKSTKSFTELVVWQKAHLFVLTVYKLTKEFPNEEVYGLASQLRRAAISIAANIAESYKKWSNKEKSRFLNIAHSSLEECRYYLILSNDLKYCDVKDAMNILEEVSKLIYSYSKVISKTES
ncbi:MAG: four helix bundle protein [Ignavibacteriota bacterium]|nr:four helix bundle protein [Ignavibacteriota bacterium]MCZ2267912.1 four helix bundle protein [Ignavibacteriales bacterium]QKK00137.1 MAG: four helix bundle protein [Ignavibacteriota bacterium]HOJ06428.1 four helix bundle protein [Ignavibacteriaceae bacterium]